MLAPEAQLPALKAGSLFTLDRMRQQFGHGRRRGPGACSRS
jgi:hypothetical protein